MTWRRSSLGTETLESYLSAELDERVVDTEVLSDGLNLVVAISTTEGDPRYVLRRPNKLRHTELFNDLQQEYALLQRLEPAEIPAPEPVLFCGDESVVGDAFFLTTYLDGTTVPRGSDLPERFQNESSRAAVADRLVETLGEIHSLDTAPFEAVCDHHPALTQVSHATDRLDAVATVTGHEYPTLRRVGAWLRGNGPSASTTTVVHGDFRPGNVLFADRRRPAITGVIDWETAMLGDPLTELGYLLLDWRDDDDPRLPLDDLETRYTDEELASVRAMNENGLSPFTCAPGSPTRRELVGRYEESTGVAFENERFYRAHAAFVMATVWADLHRFRVETAVESGFEPMVEYMAMVAAAIADGDIDL